MTITQSRREGFTPDFFHHQPRTSPDTDSSTASSTDIPDSSSTTCTACCCSCSLVLLIIEHITCPRTLLCSVVFWGFFFQKCTLPRKNLILRRVLISNCSYLVIQKSIRRSVQLQGLPRSGVPERYISGLKVERFPFTGYKVRSHLGSHKSGIPVPSWGPMVPATDRRCWAVRKAARCGTLAIRCVRYVQVSAGLDYRSSTARFPCAACSVSRGLDKEAEERTIPYEGATNRRSGFITGLTVKKRVQPIFRNSKFRLEM